MKEFIITVDTIGYYAEFIVYAKDLPQAKSRARRMALKEIKSCMKISKCKRL